MKLYKIIAINLLVFSVLMSQSQAQSDESSNPWTMKTKSVVSGYIGTGFFGIREELSTVSSQALPGLSVGFDYSYFFHHNFALGIGIDLEGSRSRYTIDPLHSEKMTVDDEGDSLLYLVDGRYRENLSVLYLSVPLFLKFCTDPKEDLSFYALLGGKLGLPIYTEYNSEKSNLTYTGYYPQWDLFIQPNLPVHGFGTYPIQGQGKLDFGPSVGLFTEMGLKIHLRNQAFFQIGGYFHYGLNNINKNKTNRELLNYDYGKEADLTSITRVSTQDRFSLMSVGVRLRYSIPSKTVVQRSLF